MSKFKGFVYGGPVPSNAGFYFGLGSGGPGICSGASPALVHVNFVNSRFYTRTSGQVGITSNGFADLLTFTGAPGREYIDANGDTVVVGLNDPRIGSYIDIGSGLFDAGIRFNSGNGEAMKFNGAALARAIGSVGGELLSGEDWVDISGGSGSASFADGVVTITGAGSSDRGIMTQAFTTVIGQTYLVVFDAEEVVSGNSFPRIGTSQNGEQLFVFPNITTGSGLFTFFTATTTTTYLTFNNTSGEFRFSNISAQEVTMPAAVSIAIEGYMTYADLDTADQLTLYDHRVDANNRMTVTVSTDGANIGLFTFTMVNGGTSASVSAPVEITPGTNVAASVAWYADAAGINIAVNGTAATEVATAIGVPDLIAADADIATDFNGNITNMTVTAAAYSDASLDDATDDGSGFNPLCPFDG